MLGQSPYQDDDEGNTRTELTDNATNASTDKPTDAANFRNVVNLIEVLGHKPFLKRH